MEISAYLLPYPRLLCLLICSQRLWKRSAICNELMVNCWWKMAIDYWGHRSENTSQHQHYNQTKQPEQPTNLLCLLTCYKPWHNCGPSWPQTEERESREDGLHFWNEQFQHKVMIQYLSTLGNGARRELFQSSPAVCTFLAHLFTPNVYLRQMAIASLAGRLHRNLPFPIYT